MPPFRSVPFHERGEGGKEKERKGKERKGKERKGREGKGREGSSVKPPPSPSMKISTGACMSINEERGGKEKERRGKERKRKGEGSEGDFIE